MVRIATMPALEAGEPRQAPAFVRTRAEAFPALLWAFAASTLHRIRRGECALLGVNLSLVARDAAASPARAVAQAVVSTLAIATMYAFNDLYDAPADRNNPKKDRTVVATWVTYHRPAAIAAIALQLATISLSFVALGPRAATAVAGVMVVNVMYSAGLKGVPVVDVVSVSLWGALYAAIVGTSTSLLVVVALMTAVCHLFQALGDRVPDAANGIRTTAVESAALTRNVVISLSVLLFVVLRAPLGTAGALTAATPLVIFFTVKAPGAAWVLTKVYFGFVWLHLIGIPGATR